MKKTSQYRMKVPSGSWKLNND